MFNETPRDIAESKLIMLYILNKLEEPIANNQLTKIVLENSLMNYFTFQKNFTELVDDSLIDCQTSENISTYSINRKGRQMLEYFSNMILPGIRNIIDSNIKRIKKQINDETSIFADFTPESETEYIVNCKILEGSSPLVDLKITVGTRKDAHKVCDNWRKNAEEIYMYLLGNLSQEKQPN